MIMYYARIDPIDDDTVFYICDSPEAAEEVIARYVQEEWYKELGPIPEDRWEAVEAYFESHGWYETSHMEVTTMQNIGKEFPR